MKYNLTFLNNFNYTFTSHKSLTVSHLLPATNFHFSPVTMFEKIVHHLNTCERIGKKIHCIQHSLMGENLSSVTTLSGLVSGSMS